MTYDHILVDREPPIATVRLNRPQVLNALSPDLIAELIDALQALDKDPEVGAIVLTGNERAFAAGADIGRMAESTVVEQIERDQFAVWDKIRRVKKPIIAAVSGWCLGGGNETAMMCDMIIASETARFGQPEIGIGIIPGAGGTQRLTQAVGKARAMELVLTGRQFTAEEALAMGLINRVVPVEVYLEEAQSLAREIASKPPIAVQMGKASVNAVFDDYLDRGLMTERRNFYMLFATEDQKEGMRAFVEKRKPVWKGR
ncbi:MAG: enoyl-CoA hydratase/isomerase family protein [Ardenticatenia bacterium]|nr:enoyl-CoA hydratase/isomerase family protein [Ardenticatenia bacterium]